MDENAAQAATACVAGRYGNGHAVVLGSTGRLLRMEGNILVRWGDGHDPRSAVPDRGVEDAVEASPFADRPRYWLSVDPTFAILEIDATGQDVLQSFSLVAEHVPHGWDLVAALRGRDDPEEVQQYLRRRQEFERSHRAGFGPEPATFGPDDLIEAASRWTEADVQRRFDALEVDRDGMRGGSKGEVLDFHLGVTERAVGSAPDPSEVPASIVTEADLDRWLLGWELDHGSPPRDRVQEWFDPTGLHPVVIRVFPRSVPFAGLAIEHWWNSDMPFALAALQRWDRRYEARLIAHFGTMLQILAAECPRDVEQAWALAREQELLCDALLQLSGDVRRHLALGLMVERKWFLHSRP